MNYEELKSAGFTDQEILADAGFSPEEIGSGKLPDRIEAQKTQQAAFNFPLALQNLGEGAWGKLKALASPETYKGLYDMSQLLSPYEKTPEGMFQKKQVPEQVIGSLGRDLLNKYGSWEKIKSTFQNTPIDPIIDASMVLTGGGSLAAKAPGWLGKVGEISKGTGMAMDPFNVAMAPAKGLSWFVSPVVTGAARRLQNSALKVNKKLDIPEIKRAVQRSLDEGLYVSEKKLGELKGKMDATRKDINNAINEAEKKGDFVDMWKAADSIDEMKQAYLNRFLRDTELESAFDNFKMALIETHGERLSPKIAQQMKMDTQKFLSGSYDKLSKARDQAEKYVASNVRQQLEEKAPNLKYLNPKMQEYVWLKKSIEKGVKDAMEAPILPGIGAFNAFKNKTIDNPLVKSRLAIALKKANEMAMKYSPTTTLGRETAYKANDWMLNLGNKPQGLMP